MRKRRPAVSLHAPSLPFFPFLIETLANSDFFFITCEHGGNRVPARYRDLFHGHENLLHTHGGYDAGALRIAREMAHALAAPLLACTTTRLLIDLNRSPGHPQLYSAATRNAAHDIRQEIFEHCYRPYRAEAETRMARAIAAGSRVIHVSCHSFTPELNGKVRNTDIGLLYDPSRAAEADLCRRWRAALKVHAAALKTRMNYPYAGVADGFTTHLRRHFSPESYVGIELEINQKLVAGPAEQWRAIRAALIQALADATARHRIHRSDAEYNIQWSRRHTHDRLRKDKIDG